MLGYVILNIVVVLAAAFLLLLIIAWITRPRSVYSSRPEEQNPMQGKRVIFVEDENDRENADGAKGHLEAVGPAVYKQSFYGKYVKRLIDVVLSFAGLILLSPVYLVLIIAILIDDPGPVFFTQKRVGKDKRYFKLHKFRSMKMATPHDVPTHMLANPKQYITKVGRFMRSHSLDELPQIWDIFIGNMSIVGPRPALWNQDLLTAERDKYQANDIKPGLTGWAQINGRDALHLADKAALDGEYVRQQNFRFDCKCFFGSVHVFRKDTTVIEGGTAGSEKAVEQENDKEMIKK